MESDNYLARHGCLDLFNLDIVAVVETHLRDKDDLLFNDFQWYGHNRTDIHSKAKKGSFGVGFMIRKSLLSSFKCIRLYDSEEGILWLKSSAYDSANNRTCLILPTTESGSHLVLQTESSQTVLVTESGSSPPIMQTESSLTVSVTESGSLPLTTQTESRLTAPATEPGSSPLTMQTESSLTMPATEPGRSSLTKQTESSQTVPVTESGSSPLTKQTESSHTVPAIESGSSPPIMQTESSPTVPVTESGNSPLGYADRVQPHSASDIVW